MPQEIFIGNIKGAKGDVGTSLKILAFYTTFDELSSAVKNPSVGDAYGVGSDAPYDIYIYSANKGWVNNGALAPDINEQTPNYAEATTLENLTSGEKISLAFGKIKKAITDLIAHKSDTTGHITSTERTAWNGKAPGGCGLGTEAQHEYSLGASDLLKKGSGFYTMINQNDANAPEEFGDEPSRMGIIQLLQNITTGVGLQITSHRNKDTNKDNIWFRAIWYNNWGDWNKIIHSGNIADYRHKIITGAYTGNGTAPRKISLDFTPDIVLVFGKSGMVSFLTQQNGYRGCGGMAFKGFPCKVGDTATIEIVDGGFNVAYIAPNGDATVNVPMTNESNAQYYYMAIRQPLV